MGISAGIYVRISQDRDGERAGVQRQREDCERLAKQHGWTVADIYEDNDVSASTGRKRPAYERMLADIESGRISAVAVWSLDRLHRRPIELERFIDLAERRKLALANVAGDVDLATSAGRLHARLMGSVARHEVEQKSERQRRAATQAAQEGRWAGGPRPFGYQPGGLKIDRAEARAIRRAYDDLLAGVSLGEIVRGLNARGVTTSLGKQWSGTQVRTVLLRARNAGLRSHLGEIVGPAQWPAIVSEDTWRAASALLLDPSRKTSPGYGRIYLLSGIAICGVCGLTVTSAGTAYRGTDGSRSRTVYRCRSRKHIARHVEPVDALVSAVIVERLSAPDAQDLLEDGSLPDTAALRQEAQALRTRLDELAVDFADGSLTASQLRTATARLRAKLDSIERAQASAGRGSALVGVAGARNVQAVWDGLPLDRRRAIVQALVRVTIEPQQVQGARRFDPDLIKIIWTE